MIELAALLVIIVLAPVVLEMALTVIIFFWDLLS